LIETKTESDVAGRLGRKPKFETIREPAVRAGARFGAVAMLLLFGAGSVQDATAVGETRSLSFHHTHSGEDLTVTFKRNGRYDDDALKKLNWFLRDWRSQDQTTMNPQLFDIVWEVYRDVDGKEPVNIISSYRSPKTNAMLRRRSSGVARFSQHMRGNAMDFYIPGVSLEKVRFAGLRLQRGGVGFYPTSGSPFVHLDTGRIRHWPRMSRDQLVRVFPQGRTVHVPSDGNPLPGYQLALADVSKRGSGDDADRAPRGKTNALAALLGMRSNDDDDDAPAAGAPKPAKDTPVVVKPDNAKAADTKTASIKPDNTKPENAAPEAAKLSTAGIPLPRTRPAQPQPYRLAAADTKTAPADAVSASRRNAASAETPKSRFDDPIFARSAPGEAAKRERPQTPADIINSRGFWNIETTPNAAPASEPQATASIAESRDRDAAVDDTVRGAMAFASPTLVDQSRIVAATASPPPIRMASVVNETAGRTLQASPAKTAQSLPQAATVAADLRPAARSVLLTAPQGPWLRALIVSPSARDFLAVSALDAPDLTMLRSLLVKPRVVMAIAFSGDDAMIPPADRFSGSSQAALATITFTVRTAALR
jgi:uncharacterized protein YcbK (DUF882 family)